MGFFSSMTKQADAAALSPFLPPLGLDKAFMSTQQTVLTVKSSTFGNDYTITDVDGKDVVLCKYTKNGNTAEIQHPQTGQLISNLLLTKSAGSVWVQDATGTDVIEIAEHKSLWFDRPVPKSQMFIRFENASTCEDVELRLALNVGKTGGLRWEVALISGEDGRPTQMQTVAWITQGQGGFSSAPYKMTIAPGVDLALMSALCVCYDSIVRSRKTSQIAFVSGGGDSSGSGGGGGGC